MSNDKHGYYLDDFMSAMVPQIQAQMKENITVPRQWPLCGEFTGDRWIHRPKGQ